MQKLSYKLCHIVSAIALLISVSVGNLVCFYTYHQPPVPEAVKKLRKF